MSADGASPPTTASSDHTPPALPTPPAETPPTPPAEAPPTPSAEAPPALPAGPPPTPPAEASPAEIRPVVVAVTVDGINGAGALARPETNVRATELTNEEVEALFAATHRPATPVYPSRVLGNDDLQKLLLSLGDDPRPAPATFISTRTAAYDDVYEDDLYDDDGADPAPAEDPAANRTEQNLRDLEISIATVDDRTVAIRDLVKSTNRNVEILQDQTDGIVSDLDGIRAQNVALAEEVRDLRVAVDALRGHLASLITMLTTGSTRAASTRAAVSGAPAQSGAVTAAPVAPSPFAAPDA